MQPKIQPDAPDSPLDQDASCLKISDDGQSSVATDTIDYVATDQNGLAATSTRSVLIEVAAAPSIIPMDDASTATTTASSTEATSTDQ
jgi:hypothetical protein